MDLDSTGAVLGRDLMVVASSGRLLHFVLGPLGKGEPVLFFLSLITHNHCCH